MKIKKIGKNCKAFIFENIKEFYTAVYLIEKNNSFFLIDTYCGSSAMEPIIDIIKQSNQKNLKVINTHFHWDHVWGNCSFLNHDIISHKLCKEILNNNWEKQVLDNKKYILGSVNKKLPNITFQNSLSFPEDKIKIFYSPGHTKDSISIFDYEEEILYVGDNLEKPIIYVEYYDIDKYISTLNLYLELNPKIIVSSHTLILTKNDILKTLNYLEDLKNAKNRIFKSEYENKIHNENLKVVYNKL